MATEKEQKLYNDRLLKLQTLKKVGVDPFPAFVDRTHTIEDFLEKFDEASVSKKEFSICGRVRALRGHGKLLFGNIEDTTGITQFVVKKDESGDDVLKLFSLIDVGDFLQIKGKPFITQRGQHSLLVTKAKLLTKTLRALPEKYHGLKDHELKLRKRYLDMLANPETRELFRRKSIFWDTIRTYLTKKDFLHVETPVLEHVPGGAEAEPFITHHNSLDQDFYLRISLELPLKRLLVGGFEKVFEIGRIFRNEGVSTEHLQDYTQMEFYWAYADYNDLMKLVEDMYKSVIKKLFGTLKTERQGTTINWGKKWERYDYYELFKEYAGIDLARASLQELKNKAEELRIELDKSIGKGRLIDLIYKKTIRHRLVEPGFLLNPPVEVEPLAKRLAENTDKVQRMQVVAWGTELGKGFSELNDPLDQRARFDEQMKLRQAGDKEAQQLDEDFIEALEYGMPPAAGFGMSERFFAVLMDKPIRDVVISPPMRQE